MAIRVVQWTTGNVGKESLTLWASAERLPVMELVRLSEAVREAGNGMQDRVVHSFYKLKRTREQVRDEFGRRSNPSNPGKGQGTPPSS